VQDESSAAEQAAEPRVEYETRTIEIDLAEVGLPAHMPTLGQVAIAAANVYERFAPYADEGWVWVTSPSDPDFDDWLYDERGGRAIIAGVRLLSRRLVEPEAPPTGRPSHGLSAYRTRQLTERPWTAEPGSKLWQPLSHT